MLLDLLSSSTEGVCLSKEGGVVAQRAKRMGGEGRKVHPMEVGNPWRGGKEIALENKLKGPFFRQR